MQIFAGRLVRSGIGPVCDHKGNAVGDQESGAADGDVGEHASDETDH